MIMRECIPICLFASLRTNPISSEWSVEVRFRSAISTWKFVSNRFINPASSIASAVLNCEVRLFLQDRLHLQYRRLCLALGWVRRGVTSKFAIRADGVVGSGRPAQWRPTFLRWKNATLKSNDVLKNVDCAISQSLSLPRNMILATP